MKHTTLARAGVAGISIVLALSLTACSSGSGDGASTDGSTVGSTVGTTSGTTVSATDAPAIKGGDEFCDIAVESLAAEDKVNKASDDLSVAMSSGDIDALHAASQAILDNSVLATRFYSLGATLTDDQATKDAFTGLADFVDGYSVAMGQAGVDAASVPAFQSSIMALFTDPELQPLLASAGGWATTTHDFTVEHCGISG